MDKIKIVDNQGNTLKEIGLTILIWLTIALIGGIFWVVYNIDMFISKFN